MKYKTIVADPPWEVNRIEPINRWKNPQAVVGSVKLSYPTLMVEEISALPIESLSEDNAHFYLWTINKYLEDAYLIARAWGFSPSTLLTWCKPKHGIGLGGTFVSTSEFCLFARRGSCAAARRIDSTWFQWPRGKHSEKPEAFIDLVESVSPAPYLELFARRNRLGWSTWGNESLCHVELVA